MISTQDNKFLSLYYCDFEGSFCGSSSENEIYPHSTHIFLAYASVDASGNLLTGQLPSQKIQNWHNDNKKVFLTLGGSTTTIADAFNNPETFVPQVVSALQEHEIDGFDFQIATFDQTTQSIIDTIKLLREKLPEDKKISITTQNIAVYPNVAVPEKNVNSQTAWNIMVPIINEAGEDIDFVQVQMYNNDYLGYERGSSAYVETVYQIWLNQHPNYPIQNFNGLEEEKLIVALLASEEAGNSQDVFESETVHEIVENLENQKMYAFAGFNIWNAHWDADAEHQISTAAAIALGIDEDENDVIEDGEDGELGDGEWREYTDFVSVYYCGFDDEFCGQSKYNDVSNDASHVILAYVNIAVDGEIEHGTMPTKLIKFWKQENKKVLISVGGRSGDWSQIFTAESHLTTFVTQMIALVNEYNLDGIDLQFRQYENTPANLLSLLEALKPQLSENQILILSMDNVTVYPDPTAKIPQMNESNSWNFFVPVFQKCPDCFDILQVSVYQNDYLSTESGSKDFLIQTVRGWLNQHPDYKIPDFAGVPQNKLVLSLLASEKAGQNLPEYFSNVNTITKAFQTLKNHQQEIKGINLWNSYFDQKNAFAISEAASDFLNLEAEEISEDESENEDDENDNDSVFAGKLTANLVLLVLAAYAFI